MTDSVSVIRKVDLMVVVSVVLLVSEMIKGTTVVYEVVKVATFWYVSVVVVGVEDRRVTVVDVNDGANTVLVIVTLPVP